MGLWGWGLGGRIEVDLGVFAYRGFGIVAW